MPARIEDYALIGDCETAPLVARDGSIDWLCWPRFDSAACFAALLGTSENGRWQIAPADPSARTSRRYRDGTLVLETTFETAEGEAVLIDFMPPRDGTSELVRLVVGRRGRMDFHRNDLRTGNGNRWTRERVTSLRSHHKIPVHRPDTHEAEGWMNLTQAAQFLGLSQKTLRIAAEHGEIEVEHPLADGPWVFNRSSLQTEVARKLVDRARSRRTAPAGPGDQQQNLFLSMT